MKFLKYFCAASLLAASAGTLWSCDDDDDKRLSDAVLASVSSLTFEAQDTSEKIITVYADADWVTEIPDWVTVTPTEGTGVMDVTVSVSENMRDGAMDNPRKAKLVFKGRTLASRAEVLVSQVGNKFRDIPEYQKIGDVIAVKRMPVVYQYKVLDLVTSRQPAKNVPAYCLNITPQEELDKLDAPRETIFVFRDRGTGRPTKKERRELDSLMDNMLYEEE